MLCFYSFHLRLHFPFSWWNGLLVWTENVKCFKHKILVTNKKKVYYKHYKNLQDICLSLLLIRFKLTKEFFFFTWFIQGIKLAVHPTITGCLLNVIPESFTSENICVNMFYWIKILNYRNTNPLHRLLKMKKKRSTF